MNVAPDAAGRGASTNDVSDPIRFDIVANYTPSAPLPAASPEGKPGTKPQESASATPQGGRP
jgi:hypothetical protein